MRQVRQQMHVHGGVRRQQIESEAGLVKKCEVTRGTATEACKIMKWRPRPSLHLARTAPRAQTSPGTSTSSAQLRGAGGGKCADWPTTAATSFPDRKPMGTSGDGRQALPSTRAV